MIVAIINDWVVTEVVDIDPSQYQQYASSCQSAIDVTSMVPRPQAGWVFDGSGLTGPSTTWQITRLAFRERFTTTELMGIIAASQQANSMGYVLQVMMQNQMVATYIDLSRSDTQAGLAALVSFGLLTSDRAHQILTTPPSAVEIYQG